MCIVISYLYSISDKLPKWVNICDSVNNESYWTQYWQKKVSVYVSFLVDIDGFGQPHSKTKRIISVQTVLQPTVFVRFSISFLFKWKWIKFWRALRFFPFLLFTYYIFTQSLKFHFWRLLQLIILHFSQYRHRILRQEFVADGRTDNPFNHLIGSGRKTRRKSATMFAAA